MVKSLHFIAEDIVPIEASVLDGDYRPLLALLEHDYNDMRQFEQFADQFGLSSELCNQFREMAMLGGLAMQGSCYWVNLAVVWLESGAPLSPKIEEALLALELPKSEQRLRHRLSRLLGARDAI